MGNGIDARKPANIFAIVTSLIGTVALVVGIMLTITSGPAMRERMVKVETKLDYVITQVDNISRQFQQHLEKPNR
jgi:uncharacterized membrane-anchored protein YhcB (DUF1043 family)